MNRIRGFTLIELLVVIIILGILAAVALPRFMAGTEAARASEAINLLNNIRQAQDIRFQSAAAYNANFNTLGVNVSGTGASLSPDGLIITTRYWTITTNAAGLTTATRLALRAGGVPPGGTEGQTIILAANGTWGGTHPNAPVTE